MTSKLLLHALCYLEVILCAASLCVMVVRRQWTDYAALGCFLAVRMSSAIALIYLHKAAGHSVSSATAYSVYFYVYWPSFAVESILALIIVYSIFKLAMARFTRVNLEQKPFTLRLRPWGRQRTLTKNSF